MGGNVTTTGDVTVDIQNYNAATINSDGNVSLSVGGNLTAADLNLFINNFEGGQIGGDAAIDAIVTGDINTATSVGLCHR